MNAKRNEDKIGRNITPKQATALPFLIQGKNVEDACKKAGITKSTYYEWLKDETFMEAYSRMQNDCLYAAMTELQGYAGKAVKRLVAMLDKKDIPAQLLRQVCCDILDRVSKHREVENIEKRLDDLEKLIGNNTQAVRRVI